MFDPRVTADQSMTTLNRSPKIAILMGTLNGARFLPEQLASFARQTHANWQLHVSDDGSTDDTLNILSNFQSQRPNNRVSICKGPGRGFVQNFLSLTCKPDIDADYYAFSDQDDVWEADKLTRAARWLEAQPKDIPALYCSRTRLIDECGNTIGLSPLFKRKPSFKNALVQCIAGANTMVFNQAARELIMKPGYETPVVSQDWWVYLLVTGCGGEVFYDPVPSIGYRQHSENLVGSNMGWAARKRRMIASFRGRFANWNEINLKALEKIPQKLAPENLPTLERFAKARVTNLSTRLIQLRISGAYRQTIGGNLSLYLATALKKI
jgi:glycosyltransferase involved in cell wall biosynthesis